MAENEVYFVEWMEEFVSQEKGSRIVNYLLKDSLGNSVLAVVGTERSLRHMVYVVADEFLSYSGEDNPIQAGFKWRSRREVVDWLTSMLAKHQQIESPGAAARSFGSNPQHFSVADKMDHRLRNLKQSYSDIVWMGASWTCGKQLKHFPAFCRNGTTIPVQSFVFVMAKEENRYVAYLDDMYEDKKGQKKVKVRWFHHSQEVKGVVRLRNAHPKEVYITPYTQVISVECVDGPAIVLTREHFEKCIGSFPDGLLGKVHICFRQFRSNKIKPFDLSKLRGYSDQPLITCLDSDTFIESDSGIKEFEKESLLGKGMKRKRTLGDHESFLTRYNGLEGPQQKKLHGPLFRKALSSKNVDSRRWHTQPFKLHDKVELLCQDSGIRGCWFRCTVLEISRKQIKLEYNDLEDQDGCGNLEEWVPSFRLAAPDKLSMRCLDRPAIRPYSPITNTLDAEFEVGDPVDAWWSDGWWEGVVTAISNGEVGNLQVYTPGENLFLNVPRKDLRISRDWVGGKWIDVKANRDILSAISPANLPPTSSTIEKYGEADDSAPTTKVDENEDKQIALTTLTSPVRLPEQVSSLNKDDLGGAYDNNVDRTVGMGEGGEKEGFGAQEVTMDEDDGEKDNKLGVEALDIVSLSTEDNIGNEEKEACAPNEEVVACKMTQNPNFGNEGKEACAPNEEVVACKTTQNPNFGNEDKEACTPNEEVVACEITQNPNFGNEDNEAFAPNEEVVACDITQNPNFCNEDEEACAPNEEVISCEITQKPAS